MQESTIQPTRSRSYDFHLLRQSKDFANVKEYAPTGLVSRRHGESLDKVTLIRVLASIFAAIVFAILIFRMKRLRSGREPNEECRYCVEGQNFRRMVARQDGRFICPRCGHVESPNVEFECNCGKCALLRHFRSIFQIDRDPLPSPTNFLGERIQRS